MGLEEESVQVGMRNRGSGCSSTILSLAAVSAFLRPHRQLIDFSDVRRDYDEYGGLNVNLEPVSGIELNHVFDQDLLWTQAGDAVELSEERLNATRALVKEVGCAVLASKKD